MGALSAATRLRPSPSVYAKAFGAELVLLDFGRGEYFGLDEVGARVWERIEKEEPLGAIADAIAERFEVTREVALDDIVELVEEMRRQGLVGVL